MKANQMFKVNLLADDDCSNICPTIFLITFDTSLYKTNMIIS